MIDLSHVLAREQLMRTILLHTYPGETSRGAKWLMVRSLA